MDSITKILLLFISTIFIFFILVPAISQFLTLRKINKAGGERVGTRSVKQILNEVNWHNNELLKCQTELNKLLTLPDEMLLSLEQKHSDLEPTKTMNIVFNSKEIACKYQGLEISKYLKSENNVWYEFEGVASYDSENRAIVSDVSKNYITIYDKPTNTGYFFKELETAPFLKNEEDLIESV